MSLGDDAIAAANRRALEDPAGLDVTRDHAARWARLVEAQRVAGQDGVVLPIATARALVRVLDGEDPYPLTPTLVGELVDAAIRKALHS